jgi:hypothetical protein
MVPAQAQASPRAPGERYEFRPEVWGRCSAMRDDTLWMFWEGPRWPYIDLCAQTITAHNPNVRVLDRKGFDELVEPHDQISISHLKLNHQADYVRAYLLYRYGGIWLDIDCIVLRPLRPLLDALAVCDYIGYRESKYDEPQLGLMVSRAGGHIISRHYEKVADFLRRGTEPEWLDLSSWPMNQALAETGWQGYLQLERAAVAPISWTDSDDFFIERRDAEHDRFFRDDALCYMLYNVLVPVWFKEASRHEILSGSTFLSYLFRRALGLCCVTASSTPLG